MDDFGIDALSRRHLLIGAATFAAIGVVAPRRSAANVAAAGSPAPAFSLASSTGPTISLADQRGKIVGTHRAEPSMRGSAQRRPNR